MCSIAYQEATIQMKNSVHNYSDAELESCLYSVPLPPSPLSLLHTESMDELSFKEGDLIMLKSRVDDQWYRGKLVSGREGIFPKGYVEVVVCPEKM